MRGNSTSGGRARTRSAESSRLRVGIDLVRLSEVQASIDRFGERFVSRIFTPGEERDCRMSPPLALSRFATRFAAKEAAFKVLRPGPHEPLPWRAVEVRQGHGGFAELALAGHASTLARRRGIKSLTLSMSHEGDYATAVVVAERSPSHRSPS
jgi:holo-[acyl-carrier protein] synthase